MEANQPANPECDKGYNQPEQTGTTQHVISIRDSLEERFRKLMDSDASVKDEDGHKHLRQVPMFLHKKTELQKYFQPLIVSIGPVHHDEKELEQGQQYKLQLTKLFIERNFRYDGTLCNDILKEIERFKECYDHQVLLEKFHGNDVDLAWMFFVDGCALIQFVRCWHENDLHDIATDQMDLLTRDLLLLDNQLPLGLLNLILEFINERGELHQNNPYVRIPSGKFTTSICWFTESMARLMCMQADSVRFNKANHLLERIWIILVKKEKEYPSRNVEATPRQFRSVKDLQAAGIILEPNNSRSSLRDISFNRGIVFCKLKIPRFRVSEEGMFLVFNLIAFEMHPSFDKDPVVTSYISFLNSLIETKEDVAELRKAGILLSHLPNDEEVIKTFTELTSSLTSYPDIFFHTKFELRSYLNDKKSVTKIKWFSEVMQVYFRNPWTITGVISASFLLILTIIQTVFSILGYAAQRR